MKTPEFKSLLEQSNRHQESGTNTHPKTIKMMEIMVDFFRDPENIKNKSKVMIFTQNRNNVQVLKKFIEE